MPGGEARLPAEQAMVAVEREHDRDRIGARKMLRLALRAIAPPAALRRFRRCPAIGAEAMPRMPVQQRLGLGERRQMVGRDEALHRDRAQVGDKKSSRAFSAFGEFRLERRNQSAPHRPAARETAFRASSRQRALSANETAGSKPVAGLLQHDHLAADRR